MRDSCDQGEISMGKKDWKSWMCHTKPELIGYPKHGEHIEWLSWRTTKWCVFSMKLCNPGVEFWHKTGDSIQQLTPETICSPPEYRGVKEKFVFPLSFVVSIKSIVASWTVPKKTWMRNCFTTKRFSHIFQVKNASSLESLNVAIIGPGPVDGEIAQTRRNTYLK